MKRLFLLPVAVLAVGLIVSGCGGGSDSSTASITKAQFIVKADAICKKGEEQIQADFQAYLKEHEKEDLANPTKEAFTKLIDTVLVPTIEQEVEEIRALGAPSGDEDQVETYLDTVEEGREDAESDPENAVQGSIPSREKAGTLAKEYGLKVCGPQ